MAKHIHIHIGGKTKDARNVQSVKNMVESVKILSSRLKPISDDHDDHAAIQLNKELQKIIDAGKAA